MEKKRKAKPPEKGGQKYKPPVSMPLSFGAAVDGLLATKPKTSGKRTKKTDK